MFIFLCIVNAKMMNRFKWKMDPIHRLSFRCWFNQHSLNCKHLLMGSEVWVNFHVIPQVETFKWTHFLTVSICILVLHKLRNTQRKAEMIKRKGPFFPLPVARTSFQTAASDVGTGCLRVSGWIVATIAALIAVRIVPVAAPLMVYLFLSVSLPHSVYVVGRLCFCEIRCGPSQVDRY